MCSNTGVWLAANVLTRQRVTFSQQGDRTALPESFFTFFIFFNLHFFLEQLPLCAVMVTDEAN